ncbi:MAG: PhzF family phenazine biosynthesis protein [Ignavibacteria bacterium]|jgi:PhzF family phenazine biosynthesis protein
MNALKEVYQINAFTNKKFEGNAAAVVYTEQLNTETMQKIAKQMNLSETAFISKSDNADYKLKWFTPTLEVELCGHATIASLHYLKERGIIKGKSAVRFETLSGILDCKVQDDTYFMSIPVPKLQKCDKDLGQLYDILSIQHDSIDMNVPPILQLNGNLFICIKSLKVLKSLTPDFKELKRICAENLGFKEVTVYTLETVETGNDAHLRFFAPYYGIDEDPVTGSANGPLLLVLQKTGLINAGENEKDFKFEQGDFIGKPGRVNVSYSHIANKLEISGNAVTMMKGEIFI